MWYHCVPVQFFLLMVYTVVYRVFWKEYLNQPAGRSMLGGVFA